MSENSRKASLEIESEHENTAMGAEEGLVCAPQELSDTNSNTNIDKKKNEQSLSKIERKRLKKALALDHGKVEFFRAVDRGNAHFLSYLLHHPDYEHDMISHQTALSRAAQDGKVSIVELLLKLDGIQPDYVDDAGGTPLSWAVDYLPRMDEIRDLNGHHEVVQILLQQESVNPDTRNNAGRTILSLAAEHGDLALVSLLLQNPRVDTESRDFQQDRTPLSWSVESLGDRDHIWVEGSDHHHVVQSLLRHHSTSPDIVYINGQTLLSRACRYGAIAIVKLLLSHDNIDPNSKGPDGRSPLSWAMEFLDGSNYDGIWIDQPYKVIKLLLGQETIDPNPLFKGLTPLLRAAISGDDRITAMLLNKSNLDVDAKCDEGRTPLSRAAELGHQEIVQLLLKDGRVDINARDDGQKVPLIWAAEAGERTVVSLLLANSDIECNAADVRGRTALSLAAERDLTEIVRLLLSDSRVNCNAIDERHQTPLWLAVDAGQDAVVSLLVASDEVELEKVDHIGRTPLLRAAQLGHQSIVEMFLNITRINCDTQDNNGCSPLWYAAEAGHEEVVKKLLSSGRAGLQVLPKSGQSAFSRAAECGHYAIVEEMLKHRETLPDSRDSHGRTPLFLAAAAGKGMVVSLLLDNKKVDPMATDSDGLTPLAAAATMRHHGIIALLSSRDQKALHTLVRTRSLRAIEFLLDYHYDIDTTDEYGRTALHIAALMGFSKIVERLVILDADLDIVDANGMTPLRLAIQHKQEDVIELLLNSSERTTDIMLKDWLDMFGKDAHIVLSLRQGQDLSRKLSFLKSIDCTPIKGKIIL